MPTLVFFPWFCATKTVEVDRFRLVRYTPEGEWTSDIRRILGAYEHAPGRAVSKATVVFVDGVAGGA
jgi:hypothetical protein